jgi:hypothetical protein
MPNVNFIDLTGQRFSRPTVIKHAGKDHRGEAVWECLCDHGGQGQPTLAPVPIRGSKLRTGHTRSCGCLQVDSITIHGHNKRGAKSSEYYSWSTMIDRCYNPNNPKYHLYGGRGITVCDHWRDSFENFLADMGPKPSLRLSIHRKNDGNYEPSKCIWATQRIQMAETRINLNLTYNGQTKILSEWSRILINPYISR